MTQIAKIKVVAAMLHAAYLQGYNGEHGALQVSEATASWKRLRSRKAKSAWLHDAKILLGSLGDGGTAQREPRAVPRLEDVYDEFDGRFRR